MATNNMDPNERSPLLISEDQLARQDNVERSRDATTQFPLKDLVTVALAVSMIALFEAASILQTIPLNEVLEGIVCRDQSAHSLGALPETPCSMNMDVQSELAFLRGWQSTFELIPGEMN